VISPVQITPPCQTKKATRLPVKPGTNVASIANIPEKMQTVTGILNKLNLPVQLREVVGTDVEKLLKYKKEKEKKEAYEKKRMEKMKPYLQQQRPPVEEKIPEERPKEVYQDETGRIRDEKGNVINLKSTSSLKININKQKEERVKELLKFQRTTAMTANRMSKIFDPELMARSKPLREKKKNNAFQFIEKGSIVRKAEALKGPSMELENSESEITADKEKADLSLQQIPAGINRAAVRVRRHDPVPDIEWWDIPLIPQDQKAYFPL